MKLHSVNPTAYGPGSTDVLVTLEKENGQLQNVPLANAVGLQSMYAANTEKQNKAASDHSQRLHAADEVRRAELVRLRKEMDDAEEAYRKTADTSAIQYHSELEKVNSERSTIDEQTFAAAQEVLAQPEAVPLDKQK